MRKDNVIKGSRLITPTYLSVATYFDMQPGFPSENQAGSVRGICFTCFQGEACGVNVKVWVALLLRTTLAPEQRMPSFADASTP
jgi:hypothetical protein